MELAPDENDLIYETYGLNVEGLVRWLVENVLNTDWNSFIEAASFWWGIYSVIAILLALLFFLGFIYARIRYGQESQIEMERIHAEEAEWARLYEEQHSKNSRWEEAKQHVRSSNPNDWRLAIIEADIILEQILTDAGYVGATIGDKLKTANPASFTTVQDAWEAHKVRNEIAHAGSDFVLTQKIANETIVRYERVFREFGAV